MQVSFSYGWQIKIVVGELGWIASPWEVYGLIFELLCQLGYLSELLSDWDLMHKTRSNPEGGGRNSERKARAASRAAAMDELNRSETDLETAL